MTTSWWKRLTWEILILLFLPAFLAAALIPRKKPSLLVWGSTPILANKYWSQAMRQAGRESMTIMGGRYFISQRDDFDRYFEDFAPRFLPGPLRFAIGACLAFIFVLRNAAVLHTSFWGFSFGLSALWPLESIFLRLAGVKTVVMSFGGDAYMASRIVDPCIRYGLLATYPTLARQELQTTRRVEHWNRHADCVIVALMIDGLGRWDVTTNHIFVIDTDSWAARTAYSEADGTGDQPVRVMHSPNHRDAKGTEFLIAAVNQLKSEGLNVELVLLEKVPNEQVRQLMREVDIHADQFISIGYGTSGIEGMASGLPVLANLEHEAYTRVFRRYAFLDECPILSTTPETLVQNLRTLVTNPKLREQLGRASRAFAEKYHSYEMAQFMFGAIYRKHLDGENVDLINLFHPLKSPYNRSRPRVEHPLLENKLSQPAQRVTADHPAS